MCAGSKYSRTTRRRRRSNDWRRVCVVVAHAYLNIKKDYHTLLYVYFAKEIFYVILCTNLVEIFTAIKPMISQCNPVSWNSAAISSPYINYEMPQTFLSVWIKSG